MNSNPDLRDDVSTEARLGTTLSAALRYIPLLTGLLAIGLVGIYELAASGLLGVASRQIPMGAAVTALVGIAHLPIQRLARRGRGYLAFWLFWVVLAIWGIALMLLWDMTAPAAVLMAWTAFLLGIAGGLRGRRLLFAGIASAVLTLVVAWLAVNPPFPRLEITNPAGLAAVALISNSVLLYVVGTVIVRLFRYRSVQSRLVVTFTLLLAIPVLFTTGISATAEYTNSQTQFGDSLQAVTTLKSDQIASALKAVQTELGTLQDGSGRAASLVGAVQPEGQTPVQHSFNMSTSGTLLHYLTVQYPSSHYEEVLVLDMQGHAMVSTAPEDEGSNYATQAFYQQGLKGFYAELLEFPSQQNVNRNYKLVAAVPLYGSSDQQDVRGVVVAVMNSDLVFSLTGPTAGIAHARTYLVNSSTKLISARPGSALSIAAWPIASLALSRQGDVRSTYVNYDGTSVFGYAAWNPTINAVIVTEIPASDLYNKALSSLLMSGQVGLFAIIIALLAAVSSSQAISEPIRSLAAAAKGLASGNLEARAHSDEQDEVGNLAGSFNAMAGQLQGVIGNLEQRVAERTEALEQQSIRLRTAAEVARDAASAPDLDALLDQAARLIRDRFGFYHTGIFLLDEKREYAVLRSSPSEAGKKMLENQHKLRVGEQGIVGRAAASGEPRIALDTGADPVYFNNPLLPNTHSEMALPLKTSEGTIGVIDIQSDEREAFTQDDIAIVQVMADQLATAIQRTNLLHQVQTQLSMLEQSYQSFTAQSWQTFGRVGRQNIGYKFDNVRLESIKAVPSDVRPLLENGGVPSVGSNGHSLQVPIRLRGQVIGVVQLRFQNARIPETTASMIQQIADRLATALENARLLEDSLRRANKERAISEITAKISSSVNMRNVLQTAVEELGRAIPGSEVMIQFRPDTEI